MKKIIYLFITELIILLSSCNYDPNKRTIAAYMNSDSELRPERSAPHKPWYCDCHCNVCNNGGCPQTYSKEVFPVGWYNRVFMKYYIGPRGEKYSSTSRLPFVCDCEMYIMNHCNYNIAMIPYFYELHNMQIPQITMIRRRR